MRIDISRKKQYFKLIISLCLLCGLWACADDLDKHIIQDRLCTVTFNVKVPGPSSPGTYALSVEDENEIRAVQILLFNDQDELTYHPIYSSNITNHPSQTNIKTFNIKIPEGNHTIVILGNSGEALSSAMIDMEIGASKTSIIKNLIVTEEDKWNTKTSTYTPFPMWSELKNVTVNASTKNIAATLLRMMVKVNVGLSTSDVKEKFKLKSIRVYNYYTQGYIAPDSGNWSSTTGKATEASVPLSADKLGNPNHQPATDPLLYDGLAITTVDKACENEIYLFEAEEGSSQTPSSNTCLVIGGLYNGSSQETFYRIDFANNDNYLSILRNHNYRVSISDIKAQGFSTPEVAFNSHPVNVEASILSWDDAQITEVVFDNTYMLGVSKGEFDFFRDPQGLTSLENTLYITTDFPDGWEITKIVSDKEKDIYWLSVNTSSGPKDATTAVKLLLDENDTGTTRSAYIHIEADRLNYKVKVIQSDLNELSIIFRNSDGEIINMLEFSAQANQYPAEQAFSIQWSPNDAVLFYQTYTQDEGIEFYTDTGYDVFYDLGDITNVAGYEKFIIQPVPIPAIELTHTPFFERYLHITFAVSDKMQHLSKTLSLRQFVYNAVVQTDDKYYLDGGRKSFNLRANAPFTVEVKDDPNNLISLITTSGTANTSAEGVPIYFDIADVLDDPNYLEDQVTLTIKSIPEDLFPDTDVILNCTSARKKSNSYIVAPEGRVLIPVDRCNESLLGIQLNDEEVITAELVWTDNPNVIAQNSNIKSITIYGNGPTAHILVEAGTAHGNAVIAIKKNGIILWSWHIWVTDFWPYKNIYGEAEGIGIDNRWMDRNLGAIGNTPGEVGTLGLFYQWGRKDPLPGSASVTEAIETTIYDLNNSFIMPITALNSSHVENFENTIRNPMRFYTGGHVRFGDWYSYNTHHNNDLWGSEASKTIYDPCPEGWRVPSNFNQGQQTPWDGLTNEDFIWIESSHGRYAADYGGFYPAASHRFQASNIQPHIYGGEITKDVGVFGFYWTASPEPWGRHTARAMQFSQGGFAPDSNFFRASAKSVRCVKE